MAQNLSRTVKADPKWRHYDAYDVIFAPLSNSVWKITENSLYSNAPPRCFFIFIQSYSNLAETFNTSIPLDENS